MASGWKRWAALGLGSVLALGAAEAGYRALRGGALGPTTNPDYVLHDPRLGWRYRPGAEARHRGPSFDVAVRINERGFRGPEWPPPDEGRARVLVLGDSFAFGWGVEEDEALPARLGRLEPGWDVLGAGVSGYGTDQERLLLQLLAQDAGAGARPDVVVVLFCENDLYECAAREAYGVPKPAFERRGGELELVGVPVPDPWLARASHVWRAVRKELWQARHARRRPERWEEWRLVADLYRGMRDDLAGVPLVIVSDRPLLAELARQEPGIEHVDLRPVLAAGGDALVLPRDGHWSALGHLRVAEAVAAGLRRTLTP